MITILNLKVHYENKEYNMALSILHKEIERLSTLRFSEFKQELKKVTSIEEFQMLLRLTDYFLMYHYSAFIARYAYKRFPNFTTLTWYSEDLIDHNQSLEAVELLTEAISNSHENSETIEKALFSKIRGLLELKRFREAEDLIEELKKSPKPIEDKLGFIYMKLGNREKAEHFFRKGIAHKEISSICYMLLSDLLAANGRLEEALTVIEEGERQFPEKPSLLFTKVLRYRDLAMPTELLQMINHLNVQLPLHSYKKYFQHLTEMALYQSGEFDRLESIIQQEQRNSIYKRNRDKGELIKIPINPIIQKNNYCVPASLEMILTYYGRNINQDEIAKCIYERTGSKLSTSVSYMEKAGFECRYFVGSDEQYQVLINKHIPVLLFVHNDQSSHVQVMTGYDSRNDVYHIQDPNLIETMYINSNNLKKINSSSSYLSVAAVPKEIAMELSFLPLEEDQYFRTLYALEDKMEEGDKDSKEEFFQFLQGNTDFPFTPIFVVRNFSYIEEYGDFIDNCIKKLLSEYPKNDFMLLQSALAYFRLSKIQQFEKLLKETGQKTYNPFYHYLRGDFIYTTTGHLKRLNHLGHHYN